MKILQFLQKTKYKNKKTISHRLPEFEEPAKD